MAASLGEGGQGRGEEVVTAADQLRDLSLCFAEENLKVRCQDGDFYTPLSTWINYLASLQPVCPSGRVAHPCPLPGGAPALPREEPLRVTLCSGR